MTMSLDELTHLYILQKDYHASNKPQNSEFEARIRRVNTIHQVQISHEIAQPNPAFNNQPAIPFVLLKPASATASSKKPLIIHTHGGPGVYVDIDILHAEITYFLSHGFVVACPNYRGSTSHPTESLRAQWREWQEKSKNKHHIMGPEDIYVVACHLSQMDYINNTILLRGGSFGSHINAHLLAGVKRRKFRNIFAGAHLSGGVKYPIPTDMPKETPLIISHALKDKIAPFADAQLFMEKIVLARANATNNNLEVFVSQQGDHHLIDPGLTVENQESRAYRELKEYLSLTTRFVHSIVDLNKFEAINYEQQLTNLVGDSNPEDSRKLIINSQKA